MSSAQTEVGKLIDGNAERDAIHVAICPMVAGDTLTPGQHVGFDEDSKISAVGYAVEKIGVVDPFLKANVRPGQWFYLFLYPATITSLKHNWTHPAFDKQAGHVPPLKSVAWLQQFCDRYSADYDELLQAVISGDTYCFGEDDGPENARDREFWWHVEAVTGKTFDEEHRSNTGFRCAC